MLLYASDLSLLFYTLFYFLLLGYFFLFFFFLLVWKLNTLLRFSLCFSCKLQHVFLIFQSSSLMCPSIQDDHILLFNQLLYCCMLYAAKFQFCNICCIFNCSQLQLEPNNQYHITTFKKKKKKKKSVCSQQLFLVLKSLYQFW